MLFQVSFRVFETSRIFSESFKGVYKKFMEVSRQFRGNLKGVSRKFQGCFK